jgi:2-polyprenyl-6-methoxyphenol hydroxylase-like FAD-dependent oxidoreductase
MALAKAGIESTVYEAYGRAADGVGGALSIAPNGLNALGVIDANRAVEAIGVPMHGMVMQSWTGKRLAEFGTPPGLPGMLLVWRADLYRALYEQAEAHGVHIEHGKRLMTAESGADGVSARFADGTQASADILIGADGIRSTVRELIDPAAPKPRYAGLLGFGARTGRTRVPSTHDRMHMVFGKRAFFGYQVLADGGGGWFANLPYRQAMSTAEARALGAEHWLPVLRSAFADDRSPALEFLGETAPEDLLITGGLEDIPTVPVWHRDRMVLIGDAAHATSPSSGQGASLAIESAVQLARCLRDLPHGQAFATYEKLRRERAERIIRMAARTNSDKAAGPVARVLRDALMPVAMKLMANSDRWAWQFDYRIDWDRRAIMA